MIAKGRRTLFLVERWLAEWLILVRGEVLRGVNPSELRLGVEFISAHCYLLFFGCLLGAPSPGGGNPVEHLGNEQPDTNRHLM